MKPVAKICIEVGCGRPRHRKEWCRPHYERWLKFGDPNHVVVPKHRRRRSDSPLSTAEVIAHASSNGQCLKWPHYTDQKGYGRIWVNSKRKYAHNHILSLITPKPFQEAQCLHACGNGHLGCVAPWHLYWGTSMQNVQDAIKHGTLARGEKIGNSRLTETDVMRIRELEKRGTSRKEMALSFGVTEATISRVISGQLWGWLNT